MTLIYRRAHCCIDVANSAQIRLSTKLKSHSEFTQMAYVGGENGGGLAKGEGTELRVTFGSARSS